MMFRLCFIDEHLVRHSLINNGDQVNMITFILIVSVGSQICNSLIDIKNEAAVRTFDINSVWDSVAFDKMSNI